MEDQILSDSPITTEKNISEVFNKSFEIETMLKSISHDIEKHINIFSQKKDDTNILNDNNVMSNKFILPKFIRNKKITDSKKYFNIAQKWIGHISEINGNEFTAKLEDLTNGGNYEIGEFDINEVSEDDMELLQIGATFYWSLGYAVEGGQVIKGSLIRFQRVFNWDEDDYNNALDRANDLSKNLKWE